MSTVTNNRISVVFDDANVTQVRAAFIAANQYMPFLIGLSTDERITLPKMNVVNKQFVQDAINAISNNTELFPAYLNPAEMKKDFNLFNQLDELVTLSMQLTEKLRDTQILAGSEAYVSALSVYRMMEAASKAGVPGADTIYDQLAERFASNGPQGPIATPTEPEKK